MKIVCISDVHGKWNKINIPKCDLLISAGDYSFRGEDHMVRDFHKWLNKQPAEHVISVQGNHEYAVEKNFQKYKDMALKECPRVHFIYHEQVEIEGVKIFGSSYTPEFCNWAYNVPRGPELASLWAQIPDNTNVLVTHGPPAGILDVVYHSNGVTPRDRVGCHDLMDRINELRELKLHVFGHIHGSAGETYFNGVKYINAAICDEMYLPSNAVKVFEL